MKGRFRLDVVVGKDAAVLQLLAGEDQALLVQRDAFLAPNLPLDALDGMRALNIERDGFAGQRLDCRPT